jgi:hypothetical protein
MRLRMLRVSLARRVEFLQVVVVLPSFCEMQNVQLEVLSAYAGGDDIV